MRLREVAHYGGACGVTSFGGRGIPQGAHPHDAAAAARATKGAHLKTYAESHATVATDSGILAAVPGEFVAAGSLSLPDPSLALAEQRTATLDAAHAGRVTITYQRTLAKHGKSRHWYWRAVRADAA